VRLAFVGRPNVGKSSLVNRILGEERQIVSTVAGTTREAVEIPFRIFDADYVLVDTAGIRRRARTKEHLEKLSVVNALAAMDRADVIVLVVDAEDGAAEQDARIAGYILERGRGLVVAMNKWDRVMAGAKLPKDAEADIGHTLRFTEFAPHVRISAVTGLGLERLFKEVAAVAREYGREVQTADLNRVAQLATRLTPPPGRSGSASRIFYGTQTRTRPPVFRFFTNHPDQIPESYSRFFENQLRYHFGFKGIPLRIEWRGREGASADSTAHKLRPKPLPKGQPRSNRKPAPGSRAGAGAHGRKGGAKSKGPFARKTARTDARKRVGKGARGARRPA
jgi:GTP-binding protein